MTLQFSSPWQKFVFNFFCRRHETHDAGFFIEELIGINQREFCFRDIARCRAGRGRRGGGGRFWLRGDRGGADCREKSDCGYRTNDFHK